MFVRLMPWFFAPDTGAAGSVPAPSTGAAPATPPVAPTSPAAPQHSDEPPAWAKALAAKVEALESQKAKLEADKGAAEAKAQTVEQQLATLREQTEKDRARVHADKIQNSIGMLASGVQFASPQHAEAGFALFKAQHKFQVAEDGSVLATGANGSAQHVAQAWDAWKKTTGVMFIAAAAQPGPAGLATAPAQGSGQVKSPKELSNDEFRACWAAGKMPDGTPIRGKLTPGDKNAPVFEFSNVVNPFAKGRQAVQQAFKDLANRSR